MISNPTKFNQMICPQGAIKPTPSSSPEFISTVSTVNKSMKYNRQLLIGPIRHTQTELINPETQDVRTSGRRRRRVPVSAPLLHSRPLRVKLSVGEFLSLFWVHEKPNLSPHQKWATSQTPARLWGRRHRWVAIREGKKKVVKLWGCQPEAHGPVEIESDEGGAVKEHSSGALIWT